MLLRVETVFPIALRLQGRSVLVIGGDDEAADKAAKLICAGAAVSVVSPRAHEQIARASARRQLVWYARQFVDHDVLGTAVVLLTDIDEGMADRLFGLRAQHRFLLGALDQPRVSDFFLVSTVERGPLTVAITTGGQAPLLARKLRTSLECGLDEHFAEFARQFAELRATLRHLPRVERTNRLEQALNGFALEVRVRYPACSGVGSVRPGPSDA
jgi:siroheme synthase-like protein